MAGNWWDEDETVGGQSGPSGSADWLSEDEVVGSPAIPSAPAASHSLWDAFKQRSGELAGATVQGFGTLGEWLGDKAYSLYSGVPMEALRQEQTPVARWGRDINRDAAAINWQPGHSWEDVKASPLAHLPGYIVEQGVHSIPDMVGAMGGAPLYIVGRATELGNERAKNNGYTAPSAATAGDIATAAPAALASTLFERFGVKGILGGAGGATALGRIGRAATREAGTEFAQENIDYAGESVGTEKGWHAGTAIDRGLAGAVAGAGIGGAGRGGIEGISGAWKRHQERIAERDRIRQDIEDASTRGAEEQATAEREAFIADVMADPRARALIESNGIDPEDAAAYDRIVALHERLTRRAEAERDPIAAAEQRAAARENATLEGGERVGPGKDTGAVGADKILAARDMVARHVDEMIANDLLPEEQRDAEIRRRLEAIVPQAAPKGDAAAEPIAVDSQGRAYTGDAGLEMGARLRGESANKNLPVVVEEQARPMDEGEIARARAAMDGGNRNGAPEAGTLYGSEGRAPQTLDGNVEQRQARDAFDLAARQRARVGDEVRDTQTAGRPEGEAGKPVYMDEGLPVDVLETRIVPDAKGRAQTVARVRRYDPRTGKPEDGAAEYEVPVSRLTARDYAPEPRMAQDFAQRADGPRPPEQPRMADDPAIRREPEQTYRATAADPNADFPGAGEGRSPLPNQPDGPGPWKSASEAEADFVAREQARRASAEQDAGQRARADAEQTYKGAKSSNKPHGFDRDGYWATDDFGFVRSDKGGPIKFGDQKMAAKWILREGQAKGPGQSFEIENHPSGNGYTLRERTRAAKPAADGNAPRAPGRDVVATQEAGNARAETAKGGDPLISEPSNEAAPVQEAAPAPARAGEPAAPKADAPRESEGILGDNGLHEKPLAAEGLTSYRAKGRYGWVMIGAKSHADAMNEARRSTDNPTDLQVWDGKKYVPVESGKSGAGRPGPKADPKQAKRDRVAAERRAARKAARTTKDAKPARSVASVPESIYAHEGRQVVYPRRLSDAEMDARARDQFKSMDVAKGQKGYRVPGQEHDTLAFVSWGDRTAAIAVPVDQARAGSDFERTIRSEEPGADFRYITRDGKTTPGPKAKPSDQTAPKREPWVQGRWPDEYAREMEAYKRIGEAERARIAKDHGHSTKDPVEAFLIDRMVRGARLMNDRAPAKSKFDPNNGNAAYIAFQNGQISFEAKREYQDARRAYREYEALRDEAAKKKGGTAPDGSDEASIVRRFLDDESGALDLDGIKRLFNGDQDGTDNFAQNFKAIGAAWDVVAEKVAAAKDDPKALARAAKDIPNKMATTILTTNHGALMAIASRTGSQTVARIARMLHQDWTGKSEGPTYAEAVDSRVRSNINALADALGPYGKNKQAMESIRDLLTREVLPPAKGNGLIEAAHKIRALLDAEHDYQRKAGLDVGKVRGYFPRAFDMEAIYKNPEGFVRAMETLYREAGEANPKASADALLNSLRAGDIGYDFNGSDFVAFGGSPVARFYKERSLGKRADTLLRDFYERDPLDVLTRHFMSSARRAEWERRFGKPGEVGSRERTKWENEHGDKSQWQVMKEAIRAEGAEEHIPDVVKHIQSATGTMYSNISGRTRGGIAWLQSFTVISLMSRSLLSSLGEPVLTTVRTGNLGDVFRSYESSIKALLKTKDAEAIQELADFVGATGSHLSDMLAAERFGGGEGGSKAAHWLSGQFLRRTGLYQWTEATRVGSVRVGQEFIGRLANDIRTGRKWAKSSEMLLADLGVPAEKQAAFAAWLARVENGKPTKQDLAGGGEMEALYRNSLYRFATQTVLHTPGSLKPYWATHPIARVAYGLLSYMYAYQKQVINRSLSQAKMAAFGKAADGSALTMADRARLAAPLALLLGFATPWMALISHLREELLNGDDYEKIPFDEKIQKHLSRAGIFGVADPLYNAISGVRYQRDPATALSGAGPSYVLQSVGRLAGTMYANSKNTNTAERARARAIYDIAILPVANGALSALRGGAVVKLGAAAGIQGVSSPQARGAWMDEFGGPNNAPKRKPKKDN